MYASSSCASSLAAPCTERVRVARGQLRLRDLHGRRRVGHRVLEATEAMRACRPTRAPKPWRTRSAVAECNLHVPVRSSRAPSQRRRPASPRTRGPDASGAFAQVGAPLPWRAGPRPTAATVNADRRSACAPSRRPLRAGPRRGSCSCTFASGSVSAGSTSKVNATRFTSRPASCSRCRSARRAGAGPRPTGCAGWPASRSCAPLPTFLTVRYIVRPSPFWTRPSPLPVRLSMISYE